MLNREVNKSTNYPLVMNYQITCSFLAFIAVLSPWIQLSVCLYIYLQEELKNKADKSDVDNKADKSELDRKVDKDALAALSKWFHLFLLY